MNEQDKGKRDEEPYEAWNTVNLSTDQAEVGEEVMETDAEGTE
jgi:hypothetical protein